MNADQRLSVTDVARLAEVGVAAVSNWRRRYATFPIARRSAGSELFTAGEIADWLDGRKIAKNDLKAGEVPGSTYGDRFLRNIGATEDAAEPLEQMSPPAETDNARRLWAAVDRLQGGFDLDSYAELVLGMLCLRVRDPFQWERVVREVPESAVMEVLCRAELRAVHVPSVPLFRDIRSAIRDDRTLLDLVRLVDQLDLSHADDVGLDAARLFAELLARLERAIGRKRGDHNTPCSLVRTMVELVDPGPHDRVYDPFCRSGELLVGAAVHARRGSTGFDGISLIGDAVSGQFRHVTWLNAALLGADVDLGHHPSLAVRDDTQRDRQFDVILANPPFNMNSWEPERGADDRRWPYGTPPRHNANFAWLQHVTAALAPEGRAAVLMSNGTTTSENAREAHIRAGMVDSGVVESVVALPARLFTSTGIPVSLWILRGPVREVPAEVLFVDATNLGEMRDRVQRVLTEADIQRIVVEHRSWRGRGRMNAYEATPGLARSVHLAEIRERGFVLNPRVYVEPAAPSVRLEYSLEKIGELRAELDNLRTRALDVRSALDAKLAKVVMRRTPDRNVVSLGWQQVRLGDVCDVLAGPGAVDRTEFQSSRVPVVLPRNIRYNHVTDDELEAVEPEAAAKLSRYRLAPGDVICVRTGELGRNGLVEPEQAGWLLGPGCMRLRPADHVDAVYLTYYLGTSGTKGWLDRNSSGSAIRTISTSALSELPLVMPPLTKQREIGAVLRAVDSEFEVHSRIRSTAAELRDVLLPLLTSGAVDPGRP